MTASATDVVGRERELAALGEFVGSISAPKALLVEGEAGIGKTTLWTRGLVEGAGRGLRVLACRPAEAETDLAFAGLADLFGCAKSCRGVECVDLRVGRNRCGPACACAPVRLTPARRDEAVVSSARW